jgi:hypothetical protein
MPDSSAPDPAASAEPASPAQGDQAASAGTSDETAIKDPKAFLAAYERMKIDAASARSELKKLQAAQQQAEEAKLSDTERLSKRTAQLEAELEQEREDRREAATRYEVERKAVKLGIVDPDAAIKLLDWTAVEYDADGKPLDIEKALTALVKAKPYLAASQSPGIPSNPTNPARAAANSGEARIWTQAEIAQPGIWEQHREAITQAMREGRVR